jgi:hypothetical protein
MSRKRNTAAMNLRTTSKDGLITDDDDSERTPILTDEEQRKMIDDMKEQAIQQTEGFRKMFSGIFIVFALIFVVCGVVTLNEPYKFDHQKHFADMVPVEFFLIYYLGSTFCFIVAALVARVRNFFDMICKFFSDNDLLVSLSLPLVSL